MTLREVISIASKDEQRKGVIVLRDASETTPTAKSMPCPATCGQPRQEWAATRIAADSQGSTFIQHECRMTRPRVMRDVNGGLWWLVSTWEHLAHLRAIKRLQRRALKRLPSDQRPGKLFSSAFQSRTTA